MMNRHFFEPDVVSKREDLLKSVLKSRVVSMIRYGLEPKENFTKEYDISDKKKAFSLSEGALVIKFENGTSIGFNSDEELCSIIIWAENFDGQYRDEQLQDDIDLFPIKCTDEEYSTTFFSNILNKSLVKYEIIKQEPYSATYYSLPREVGVVLIYSDGSQFILSHQLTKEVSDNFTVLNWEQIDQDEIYPTLYKTSQFWN